jgi:hypothetical protein
MLALRNWISCDFAADLGKLSYPFFTLDRDRNFDPRRPR